MMQFDAFISYSSHDKTAADAACAVLEGAGIRCWIAPRDIMAGGEYGAAIIDAIDRCKVMVLIFSSSANESQQIRREIERAVSKGVAIVPVRIEEVVPTKSMEYFLGAIHWLDALTPPIERHLQKLGDTVRAILAVEANAQALSAGLPADGKSRTPGIGGSGHVVGRPQPDRAQADVDYRKSPRRSWVLVTVAIATCVVLIAGGIWYYETRIVRQGQPNTAASPPSQTTTLVPETVPFIPGVQRTAIRTEYLPAPDHKALAISFSRAGYVTGQSDDATAKAGAIDSCNRATAAAGTKNQCYLYAVGSTVVFAGGNPPLPPAPWVIRNAAIETPFDSAKLPLVTDSVRKSWATTYPKARKSKSLALAPAGVHFYYQGTSSPDEAIRRSLETCGYTAGVACMIVAVDDSFVVPIPITMKVTGFFHIAGNVQIALDQQAALARRFGNATNAWNGVAVGVGGNPGLILNAANEQAAIDGALADCRTQDRDCHVIALGPFTVAAASASK
jgi:hypothetical protein